MTLRGCLSVGAVLTAVACSPHPSVRIQATFSNADHYSGSSTPYDVTMAGSDGNCGGTLDLTRCMNLRLGVPSGSSSSTVGLYGDPCRGPKPAHYSVTLNNEATTHDTLTEIEYDEFDWKDHGYINYWWTKDGSLDVDVSDSDILMSFTGTLIAESTVDGNTAQGAVTISGTIHDIDLCCGTELCR